MKKRKYDASVFRSMSMITQFGIHMIVPIVMCSLIGWYIDEKLGTSYCMVILFFIGALAGFRNIYIMAKHIFDSKGKDND